MTDRCNIRCRYCMPEQEYVWLPRQSILTYEENLRLVGIFASLGMTRVRITGGEPLLRHDLSSLVRLLSRSGYVEDIALTTNGVLLARYADELKQVGLSRVTISLDTLQPGRFREFTRSDRHADVLAGIDVVQAAGFQSTKINSVVIRGTNDDELIDLLEFGRAKQVEVRFIEYMDVGGATRWSLDQVMSKKEMLQVIGARLGRPVPLAQGRGNPERAPAERFSLPDGTKFGIIASTTEPFCRTCDRSRLTADGTWFLCLYARSGVDLRGPIRAGATDADLAALIADSWADRVDRGAEQRLSEPKRGILYQVQGLREDPHREMHTRGG